MSEYQYYEFQAVDRPLSKDEQAELRSCSSRARISSTHFVNEYHWGDLNGNPMEWMEHYFDAYLYLSNFGSRVVSLRLPLSLVDLEAVKPYEVADVLKTRKTRSHLIVSFILESESGEYDEDDEGAGLLATILPVRESLARGDLRALYLGWLMGVSGGFVDDAHPEPLVPPGLGSLDGGLDALAGFLHIDPDLLAVAARHSPSETCGGPIREEVSAWLAKLPSQKKDTWLSRLLLEPDSPVALEFQRAFLSSRPTVASSGAPARTARQLLTDTKRLAETRLAIEREKAAAERRDHLMTLAGKESSQWKSIIKLTESSSAGYYDSAVRMLIDLRDFARLTGDMESFQCNLEGLIELRRRKSSFMARLQDAGLQ